MKTKLYGAYGSNMNLWQIAHRCPDARVYGTGTIKDYRLTFRASGVANIEPYMCDSVPIVLWNITNTCEKALDRYEGYPDFYTKTQVPVVTEEGDEETVFVYVMTEKFQNKPALPSHYYFNIIKEGYKENNIPPGCLTEALGKTQQEVTNWK